MYVTLIYLTENWNVFYCNYRTILLFVISFKIFNFGQNQNEHFVDKKRPKDYYFTNVNVCRYIDFSV